MAVTDGVLEARNADGTSWRDNWSTSSRAAHEAADDLAATIEGAALSWQTGPPHDDIAVVVVKAPRDG